LPDFRFCGKNKDFSAAQHKFQHFESALPDIQLTLSLSWLGREIPVLAAGWKTTLAPSSVKIDYNIEG